MKTQDLKYSLPFSELRKTVRRELYDGYPVNPKTLGEQLKKKRMDLGLSQEEAARRMKVAKMLVVDLEHERAIPSSRQLQRVFRFLT